MAAPTTYQTETELSSVNSILGAIGQSPVSRIYQDTEITKSYDYTKQDGSAGKLVVTEPELVYINPEVAFVHQLLMEVNQDVQNEGWVFNREDDYTFSPDSNKNIIIRERILGINNNSRIIPVLMYESARLKTYSKKVYS